MSLAASGGLGGGGMGGGMAMAHQTMPQPHQHTRAPPGSGGGKASSGPSMGMGALAMEVESSLSSKHIRKSESLPIITYDVYGSGAISYFPPLEACGESNVNLIPLPDKIGTDLRLRCTDGSYRAVKKLLSKGGGEYYKRVLEEGVVTSTKDEDETVVTLASPHVLLGARRISQVHPLILEKYSIHSDSNGSSTRKNVSIEPVSHSEAPVCLQNTSLDGSSPQNNDYDRVSFLVDILPGVKKPMTLLPEEAVQILQAQAARLVMEDMKTRFPEFEVSNDFWDYPFSVCVPGWNMSDNCVETHMECSGSVGDGMVFHRPLAAMVGALSLSPANQKLIQTIVQGYGKNAQRLQAEFGKDCALDDYADELFPLCMAVGVTKEGMEMIIIQLKDIQKVQEGTNSLPFRTMSVIGELHCNHNGTKSQVMEKMGQLIKTSKSIISQTLPPENQSPVAIIFYGDATLQEEIKVPMKLMVKGLGNPLLLSVNHAHMVSIGATSLAAAAHERSPGLNIRYVSPCAVGVRTFYHTLNGKGGEKDDNVKVLFDFERRLPTSPYKLECSAAECAAIRSGAGDGVEAVEKMGGTKNIPQREEGAKNFSLQIVQKLERNGAWIPIGDVMTPLLMDNVKEDDDEEKKEKQIAIEDAVLEVTLGHSGLISSRLVTDGESVEVATKTARNTKIQYYATILFCILFFGGFLLKSYWEDHVFERDAKRVLSYYKHVDPNSMHDGDVNNARYLVYKYRGRKDKLWRRLEVKYGVPVPEEWDDDEEEVHVEDIVDMDQEEEQEEEKETEL